MGRNAGRKILQGRVLGRKITEKDWVLRMNMGRNFL